MPAKLFLIIFSILAIIYSGCLGSSKVISPTYFSLNYPLDKTNRIFEKSRYPFTLRIKPVRISLAYDRPQIVYRYSPFEFQYYNYKLWAAKPQKLIHEMVYRHILHSNILKDVVREYGETMPNYELETEVVGIEEYDSLNTWYAHLAINFTLVRFQDKKVVLEYSFDEKKEVFNKEPVYIVKALSEILEAQTKILLKKMDEYMQGQ
jgi:ABC-type uncharacterized transport system auxiliary subunit